MADVIWTSPAFRVLEGLPQEIAFGIVRSTDRLRHFPEMGPAITSLPNYRQLIYRRRYRVIYRYEENENSVFLVNVQNCRQKLPSTRRLDRDALDLPLK